MKYFKKERIIIFEWGQFLIVLGTVFFFVWKVIEWMNNIAQSLPLSQLIITGKRFYTTDHDIRQAVLNIGSIGTFMTQDIRIIQKKIKQLPWIKQVSIRKQWPNKIKVYIVEYIPIAFWNRLYMLDKDAVLFIVPKERINNNKQLFPILLGPEGSERNVLTNFYIFSEILQFSPLEIKLVSIDHRFSWEIILKNNTKLILGRKDYIDRLRRFIEIYPIFLEKYISRHHEFISYIDLRYKSGFAVKKDSKHAINETKCK